MPNSKMAGATLISIAAGAFNQGEMLQLSLGMAIAAIASLWRHDFSDVGRPLVTYFTDASVNGPLRCIAIPWTIGVTPSPHDHAPIGVATEVARTQGRDSVWCLTIHGLAVQRLVRGRRRSVCSNQRRHGLAGIDLATRCRSTMKSPGTSITPTYPGAEPRHA